MLLALKAFIVPVIVACAMFMEAVDANVIVTALPEMARTFGHDPVTLKVAVTSYVLGLGVFIPVCGWFADRFGARTIFRVAIGIFIAGSLLCAASTSLFTFTLARFVQGVGGAMMVPVGRIIIFRVVERSEYIRAMNYLSVPAMLGPAAGPLLGGFITTYLHWRLIFFINIPIGILGIWLTNRHIRNTHEPHPGPLDWTGFTLSAGGASLFMLGLSFLDGGLVPVRTAVWMAVSGALLLALYVGYAYRVPRPLLDLRFFRVPTFQASVLGGSLFRIGLGAVPFLLPLVLQEGHGMSAFESGLITCASAFGGMFMRTLASTVLRRFGFRNTLIYNAVLSGVAIAACGLFFPGTPTWLIWAVVLLGGFFPALQFTSLNSMTYAEIDSRDVGRATSLGSVVQQMSLGLGVTVAGIVLQITRTLNGHATLAWSDFWPAFVAVGLCPFASILVTRRLARNAGDDIARGRRVDTGATDASAKPEQG
ncbi:MFS transporter [Paraburkholderia caballeronis]|uniref:Drug resistance transporter, EmrB/QacA subfamily n=1 Tax=Paraburkholderia caballeronis TaxID=416943 RepID=A0A1H7RNB5_9BURK|nr:MFS transporter [Paraburkholderia caballeronis]PXW23121.1 EmrB/QacA subfamily drug resistance transporter [Paraburkholderia caballeronis]PXW97785.1 EmrB/QacA subfamily drug resistance transporter [Paraburkholderia caballeronis]RAJ94755.1 EmrB/QacA subfamily drug resistance transporter [Paraburkholderia caballeronis]TDV11717.1 EmrB/QacA subfamily drug resistance transporter [Paraburkholderia caballeronis]TDV14798.1 EmrB/QacA subfamily drug resistance transporter [Paraburkholderia caballeroni